jgi:hypothetical protein
MRVSISGVCTFLWPPNSPCRRWGRQVESRAPRRQARQLPGCAQAAGRGAICAGHVLPGASSPVPLPLEPLLGRG